MLTVKISKKFQNKMLYNDVNLRFDKGIYLLKGDNGSGKTTLFNILFKLDKEYTGEILVNNKNIKDIKTSDYRTNYISYVNQEFDLFEELTPQENLNLLIKNVDSIKLDELIKGLRLEEVITSKKKVINFSGGQKQKLKILIGLLTSTPILLLDEPDNNLDLDAVSFLADYLLKNNKIIIMTGHHFSEFLNQQKINVLEIKDFKIEFIKKLEIEGKYEYEISKVKLDLSENLLKKLSKSYRSKRFVIYLLLIIFTIFYTVNIFALEGTFQFLEKQTVPMSDNVIEIFAPVTSNLVRLYGDASALKTTPYYFTHDVYEKLQSLEEIDYITPISNYNWRKGRTKYDTNLEIDTATLDYEKYGLEEYKTDNIVQVKDDACVDIKRVNTNGFNTCGHIDRLIYGQYPDDNSNQVLVDIYIAMYFAQEMELENLDDLIGETISFDVTYADPDNKKYGEKETMEYVVSGIDVAGITNGGIGQTSFYTLPYQENSFEDIANHIYKGVSPYKEKTPEELALYPLYSTYANLKLPMPTVEGIAPVKDNAYLGFYIETEDVPGVVKKIQDYDPYIVIESNYTRENSSNFIYLKNYYMKRILIALLNIIFLILLTYIAIMYYNKQLNKKVYKLKRFGFNEDEVHKYILKCNEKLLTGINIVNLSLFIIISIISYFNLYIIFSILFYWVIIYGIIKIASLRKRIE